MRIQSVVLNTTLGEVAEIEPVINKIKALLPGVPVQTVAGRHIDPEPEPVTEAFPVEQHKRRKAKDKG